MLARLIDYGLVKATEVDSLASFSISVPVSPERVCQNVVGFRLFPKRWVEDGGP